MADTPNTSPVVEMPPAQPAVAAPVSVPGNVFFKDPTTQEVYRVDPALGSVLAQSGFEQVEGPAVAPAPPGIDTSSPGAILKTFAESALGTALPIVGPAAEAAIFGNKAEQLARREAHPEVGFMGSAAGVLGTGAVGKVLGAGARALGLGAEAAEGITAASKLTAPRLFEAAGKAAEGAVAKLAPEAIGVPAGIMAGPQVAGRGGAMARLVAAAANQATQGALYAGADIGNRLVLGDDLTAEQIMREGGTAILFNGALGAAGSGAMSVLRGLIGGAGRAVETAGVAASSANPATAELLIQNRGVVRALDKAVPGAAKSLDAATPEVADFVMKNGPKVIKAEQNLPGFVDVISKADNAQQAQQIMDRWGKLLLTPAEREAAGIEWQKLLTDTAKSVRESGIEHSTEWRPKNIQELAGGAIPLQDTGGRTVYWVPRASAETAMNSVLADLDAAINTGRARPVDFHQPEIARLEKMAGQMQDQLTSGKYPDAPNRFILRPDKTPADVFNYIVDVRRQAEANLPFDDASPIPGHTASNTRSLMNELRNSVRGVLHDNSTWERLADVQKEYDAAKSAHIDATDQFNKLFLDKHTGEATAKKVDDWLKQVSEGRGRDYTKALNEYFDASKNYADVMAKSGMAEGPTVRKLIEAAEQKFKETLAQGHVTQLVENLVGKGALPAAGTPAWQSAALVAARASGVHGVGTVFSALNRLRSPSMVAGTLNAVDAVKASFNKALDSHIASLFGSAAAAATPSVIAMTKITPSNYQDYVATVSSHAGMPDVTAQALESRMEPVIHVDPMMAIRLHGVGSKAAMHLRTTLPRPIKVGVLDPAYRPSGSELRTLNRHAEVVQDPLRVLAIAKQGRLTDDHVRALDAAYPQIANEMRLAIATKLAENPSAIKKLPRATQGAISHLLGYDLRWGTSAPAIAGTQRLYQSMGKPQDTSSGMGERARNVDLKSPTMYATSTESVTRSLNRMG